MQGKRPKKNSLQFIVHLLFNGDTGKVQITKRNACTFIYIMPRWAYSLSVAVGIVPRAAMWAKKRTDSPSAATASGVLCQLRCHTCLELGSVAVVTMVNRALSVRQIIFAIWTPRLRFTVKRLWRNQFTAHGGAISQPFPFLLRQRVLVHLPSSIACSTALHQQFALATVLYRAQSIPLRNLHR